MKKKADIQQHLDLAATEFDEKGYQDLADEVDFWSDRIQESDDQMCEFIAKSIRRIDAEAAERDRKASLSKLGEIRQKVDSAKTDESKKEKVAKLRDKIKALRYQKAQQTVVPQKPQQPQQPMKAQEPGALPKPLEQKTPAPVPTPEEKKKEEEVPGGNPSVPPEADPEEKKSEASLNEKNFEHVSRKLALQRLLLKYGVKDE